MADQSIRNEFIEGVMEVYSTLMNNGSEETDGVFLYMQNDTDTNIYGESKFKHYHPPVLLVCKAVLTPIQGEADVQSVRDSAVFTVPCKSLTDNGINTSHTDLDTLRRAVMKFHDVWYTIDNVSPQVYVEDTFLVYKFDCTEIEVFDEESIVIDYPEEEPEEPEEPEIDPDNPDPPPKPDPEESEGGDSE